MRVGRWSVMSQEADFGGGGDSHGRHENMAGRSQGRQQEMVVGRWLLTVKRRAGIGVKRLTWIIARKSGR